MGILQSPIQVDCMVGIDGIIKKVVGDIRVAEGNKYPKIAPDFGPDSRRFEGGISGIFTLRSNAVAGPKDKQDGIIIFFRDPKGRAGQIPSGKASTDESWFIPKRPEIQYGTIYLMDIAP